VRLKLRPGGLVIEDGAYGMIRWKQSVDRFPDFGMTFGNPDFERYAEGVRCPWNPNPGDREFIPALERAFSDGGVHLVAVADRLFRE